MSNYRKIAFAVLLGSAMSLSHAFAQDNDGDDDDDDAAAPAATETAAPAEAEKPTRASKDVPELVLGTKEDQFAVKSEGFHAYFGPRLSLENHRAGRA
ncbi:MAG: hypothetical protein QM744_13110 [Mesorhizobium sp.]